MLKFQLYPGTLPRNIPVLIQVMMEALSMRAPPMQSLFPTNTQIDATSKRHYFSKARELVAAQAKTLSFLTYLLRGFSKELKPYEDRLATNVVALMSTCPRESIATRKELLVATRHLLNSDFRTGFFNHVDALLDERVLMGCNHRYSEQTVLRPLAFVALSDLVHHVKARLTMKQMSKVVCMFSRILHDSSSTLPLSTQYTAVRTLLSVVEIIFQNKDPNPQIGRDMLVRILSTLVHKLSTLKEYFAAVKRSEESNLTDANQVANDLAAITFGAPTASFADDSHNAFLLEKTDARESDGSVDVSDSWRDLRSMIRAIVVGHKTVIWYINNYRGQREKDRSREKTAPVVGSNEEVSSAMLKMTNSERALIDKYILLAIPCMKILKQDSLSLSGEQGSQASSPGGRKQATSDQYRDVLSYFAAAFTTLDGYDLKRTLGKRLHYLVEAIVEDSAIMVVPRHLLGSNSTTSYE
jgi:transformation/transcription domain-associated protein